MRIRIFRAATLAEAMALIREELGLDALILGTRNQGGLVEVTAALEPEDEPGLPVTARVGLRPATQEASTRPVDKATADAPDALRRHGLPAGLAAALQQGPLEAACSRLFRFVRMPLDADGPPLMLAGPPGAGKTLTIAKLAARLVMEGHRPLVITADERRAGAVEQLAAFTRLLGLTLIAAGRPETLDRALRRRELRSPALIDAPGLDLLDPEQSELLASLVSASKARLGLVLPAGLDPAEATDVATAHARQGAEILVATRLDRAGRLGGILAASHVADLALTEAGTGADVANGLAPITAASLAVRLAATHQAPPQTVRPAGTEVRAASGGALALHMAAQAGARSAIKSSSSRAPFWSANP